MCTCNRISIQEIEQVRESFSLLHLLKMFELAFLEHRERGIPGQCGLTSDDNIFLDKVKDGTVYRDNRYEVPLPFKDSHCYLSLPNNRELAVKRANWQKRTQSEVLQ